MKVPVFINIFRFEDGDFERIKSKYKYYILEESELSEYLKTYPSCYSIVPDEDYKKKKKRLHKKYGLEMFGRED